MRTNTFKKVKERMTPKNVRRQYWKNLNERDLVEGQGLYSEVWL